MDITIALDFKQGKIVVTDNSSYPAGVAANIKGVIYTKQPDTIERNGDWESPDIIYSGGVLKKGKVELRKQANQKPQQGAYVVKYTVDHPDYTPSTITKTFVLSYQPSEISIEKRFDVFTPSLKVNDGTDYSKGGFNIPSVSRVWGAAIAGVGAVAGNTQLFDLVYSGQYYDAAYAINLETSLTYQHSIYDYLTVVDKVTGALVTTANTPPSYTTMAGYLKTLKERLDASESCNIKAAKDDYVYAESLLNQIKSRICSSDFVGLYDQIQDYLNVYHRHVTVAYTNTAQPIPTYDYSDVDCGTGGGSGNDPRISSTDINNWNAAVNSIAPNDLEFEIGVTAGGPIAGTDTFSLPAFVNRRVRLTVNKIPVSQIDWQNNFYYSKPLISDTITIYNYTWGAGDLVQIQFY